QSAAVSQATSTSTATGGVSQTLSQIPQALQGLATGGASTDPIASLLDWLNSPLGTALNTFSGSIGQPFTYFSSLPFLASGVEYMMNPLYTAGLMTQATAAPEAADGALGAGLMSSSGSGASSAGVGGAEVSAGLGRAASVGGLSVPQSWGSAAPEIRLASAAKALPGMGLGGVPEAGAIGGPGGIMGGVPPVGSVVNAPRNGEPRSRYAPRPKVVATLPGERGGHDDTPSRSVVPHGCPRVGEGPLSERERAELDQLRHELAELAMERDAAARLIKEAIRP
ncbi:PE/PPE C-terminal domain-containing protein, partial [Mycobacterium branderi]